MQIWEIRNDIICLSNTISNRTSYEVMLLRRTRHVLFPENIRILTKQNRHIADSHQVYAGSYG